MMLSGAGNFEQNHHLRGIVENFFSPPRISLNPPKNKMFAIFWKRLMTGLIVSKNSVLLTHNFADLISCRIAANFQFPKPSSNDVHYAILKILKFGGVQKVLFDLRCFWISTRIWLSKLWLCEFAWCTNENREMCLEISMMILYLH